MKRIVQMQMEFTIEGLHWFNVFLDESILTTVPLMVKYDRLVTQNPKGYLPSRIIPETWERRAVVAGDDVEK